MPDATFIANQLIVGYDLIPKEVQRKFECSESGLQFCQITESYSLFLAKLHSTSWFSNLFSSDPRDKEVLIQDELTRQRRELTLRIGEAEEYQKIVLHIMNALLTKEIDDFHLLTPVQQELVGETKFSKRLLNTLVVLDSQLEKIKNEQEQASFVSLLWNGSSQSDEQITRLKTERADAISLWKTEFLKEANMASLRKTIDEKKERARQQQLEQKRVALYEHIKQLGSFFPLLNYRKSPSEESIMQQILKKYSVANDDLVSDPHKVDEEELTDLLYYCIQQISQAEITFMDLDGFNKKHANEMAVEILNAFNGQNNLDLDKWLLEYESKLHEYILKQLQLINGKNWEMTPHTTQELVQSLSFLWKNPLTERANQFLGKMADAHAFIQATSFSTQNESSFLAILDLYNYGRHHEQISELRSILTSLLAPLQPLYDEYKDIALYEKNVYMKAFRSIIPILLTVGVIIAIFALTALLLTPLALPELAFTVVFIPALLIGLAVTTKYVSVKNDIYKSLREWYYGDSFEIPEFQVNQRMLSAFGEEKAQQVRNFYVDELKKCDVLEVAYSEKHAQGILSQEDIDLRKENIKRRYQLNLEWYDIHSNNDLNYRQAPVIVAERLQHCSDEEYKELQKIIKSESESIRQSVAEVTHDIKETITEHTKGARELVEEKGEAPTIKAHYRYGLFTPPQALKVKARVEELVNFNSELNFATG
ncbi:hypothetical protein [Legionella fallonii]|uniref:Uncharacterized protein n=1 Tax=Legionella fallonii LLAP-10 TaxID=1212491 RepID=A0A098G5F6_9GAMM|nr:hypothetical protein [Legionella fallonii]CEG57728.1 protein of unknown function [Legionella fallonii LLAP-10]